MHINVSHFLTHIGEVQLYYPTSVKQEVVAGAVGYSDAGRTEVDTSLKGIANMID